MSKLDPGGLFSTAIKGNVWARDARRTKAASHEFTQFLELLAKELRTNRALEPTARELRTSSDELLKSSYAMLSSWLFDERNNHYQVLGLELGADEEGIKRRYRLLIGLFHPDKAPAWAMPGTSQVSRIHEAYRLLKDKGSRLVYDRALEIPLERPRLREAQRPARQTPMRKSYGSEWPDAIYRMQLLQRYPKTGVWILLLALLALLLLGAYFSAHEPALRAPQPSGDNASPAVDSQALERERQALRQLGRN